ncbi:MAG: SIS domain-containing protein [Hyphomicrobiales bacterium]|nr:SIS domain-containing protein [Hyphomicrobiales bacterium]
MTVALNQEVQTAISALAHRDLRHIFLVGCGGSLSIMHTGKYFLDRHSVTLACDLYNADEFVCRDPARLGPGALVLLCSQTGATVETLRAAEHARQRGALTVGMTLDLLSPLAKCVDVAVPYESSYATGAPIDAAKSNYGVLLSLLAHLLEMFGGAKLISPLSESLGHLNAVIDRAHGSCSAKLVAYAPRFARQRTIYTLASGAAFGAAYSFAICVLMEMQWYDSQAIHANEFFHGPFEVVDKNACFIVLNGLDQTRRLTERARAFLLKFGAPENILILDAMDLDMTDIDEAFRPYLAPLILFDVLWRFAYWLADLRQQPMLEGRRYMKKIANY